MTSNDAPETPEGRGAGYFRKLVAESTNGLVVSEAVMVGPAPVDSTGGCNTL